MNLFAKSALLAALALMTAHPALAKEKKKESGKSDEKEEAKFSVPIPVGHGGTGITIPYFDLSGHKQMEFHIGDATRIDENHLQMANLRIETYDDEGAPGMVIDMPASTFDLQTRFIMSKKPVLIRRADFEIIGETIDFDTKNRVGKILGKTRMLIFNMANMTVKKQK